MYIEILVLFSAENCVFYVHSERQRVLKTNECWRIVVLCVIVDLAGLTVYRAATLSPSLMLLQ
jgi:hypothetical protein